MDKQVASPFWIKCSQGLIEEIIMWPNGPIVTETHKDEVYQVLSTLNLDKYNEVEVSVNFGVPGIIHLKKLEQFYMGIWIPDKLVSLRKLVFKVFFVDFWHLGMGSDLDRIVDEFHNLRSSHPEYFNLESKDPLTFAPTWLLNSKMILELLTYYNYDEIFQFNLYNSLAEYLLAPLSQSLRETLTSIPQELKLTILKILEIWLDSLNYAEGFEFLWHVAILLSPYPSEFEILAIKFFLKEDIHNYFSEREIHYLNSLSAGTNNPEIARRAYFILGNYSYKNQEFAKSIQYFNQVTLIREGIKNVNILAKAYIKLAKIYHELGDYTNSAFHYAIALTFLKEIEDHNLYIRAKQEYMNLKFAQTISRFYFSIHLINLENASERALISLLSSLYDFLKLLQANYQHHEDIISVSSELLSICINQLRYNSNKFGTLGVDGEKYAKKLLRIIEEPTHIEIPQFISELGKSLDLRRPLVISRIVFQMQDGRLITGFRLIEGKLVQSTKDDIDSDVLFSSSIAAVNMVVSEALNFDSSIYTPLKGLDLGSQKMVIGSGDYINLILFTSSVNEEISRTVENVVKSIEEKWNHVLNMWMGSIHDFTDLDDWINPFRNMISRE